MIPVFLSIQGLYSYQETQEIDFQKLMSAQLFGIFGSVGSGKSSILEAITFALYGESERLNAREKRAYNMMNLRSETLRIIFDFESGSPTEFYRCEVNGKRNKKDFQQVELKRSFYKKENETLIPITETEIIAAIGLSYEHFKRTIIIPQGKFQDFVHLSSSDRTKMLQEIFQLEKFDLAAKTNALSKKNELEKERTQGELNVYESYKDENIAIFKSKIEENEQFLTKFKLESTQISKEIEEYQVKIKKHNEYQRIKTDYEQLMLKSEEIKRIKIDLENYIHYKSIFQSDLLKLSFLEDQLLHQEKSLSAFTLTKTKILADLEKLTILKKSLEPDFEKVEIYKQEISDLKLAQSISEKKQAIQEVEKRVLNAQKWFDEAKQQQQKQQTELLALKEKINLLKSKTANQDELYQIKEWFSKFEFLQKKHTDSAQNHQKLKENQEKHLFDYISRFKMNSIDEVYTYILNSKTKNESLLQQLRTKEQDFLVKQEVSRFSSQLITGKACPICGSTEHPDPISAHDVEDDLILLKNEIAKIEKTLSQISTFEKAHLEFVLQQDHAKNNIQLIASDIEKAKEELDSLRKKYSWTIYENKEAFDKAFELVKQHEKELVVVEKEKEKLEQENAKLLEQVEKGRVRFQDLVNEQTKYSSEIQTLESQIQLLKSISLTDFALEIEKKESQLNSIVLQFNNTIKEIQTQEQLFAGNEANINTLFIQKNKNLEDKTKITDLLVQKLIENNQTKEKIQEILLNELDEIQIRKEIQQFDEKRIQLITIISSLEKDLIGFKPNEDHFKDLTAIFNEKQIKIQELTDDIATLKSKLIELATALEKKKLLQSKLEAILSRESSLRIMKDLFRGAGFVNYVSSIYLKQLCAIANTRFRKLTNQQMELEIGDDNNFYIKDFLHDGQLRHVKTLSGGQTFQISLSLALALAESIQQQQRNQQNFFFLDEGFGTLDKDALGLVFETLKMLRKENRFVGLISHVEELQQEIPLAIKITNDAKKGSIIQTIEY